jgi:hypothetical protein
MPFAAPLALLGLLFVPAIVAMYLLKLRRTETIVPSTLLWQRLAADVEANAPWQRLRRSWLFLDQLLLDVVLALLAAQPFHERPAGLARDIVLIVDTSASMAATDVAPDRLTAAKRLAIDALRDLPAGGKVSVVEAGRTARIVSSGTADTSRVRQAIESLQASTSRGDLTDALALAQQLAAQSRDAEVLIATDAALAVPPATRVAAPIRVLRVGDPDRGRKNQAIVALAVRTSPSSVTRSVFVSVANVDLDASTRRLEVWGDDHLLEARTLAIDGQQRSDVIVDDVPPAISIVEARLIAAEGAADAAHPDQLAADDRAWAIVPPDHPHNVLIVGPGDPYLEVALSHLPNTRLFGVTPDRYPADATRTDGTDWDLVVFEGFVPSTLPATPILAIAPPTSSALGEVAGTLTNPGIGAIGVDEPIVRYVDLSTVHIAEARALTLPAWARTVIPGPKGAPLLYTGSRGGVPTAVLAFEPRQSDLPLQVAFPILIANLTGELLGGSSAPIAAVRPGDPVALTVPAGALGLRVIRPDGASIDLMPGAGGSTVTYTLTDRLGVYSATPILAAATSPGASASAGTRPSPSATASSGASSSAEPAAAGAIGAPLRFAVDLFDVDESTIAPGRESDLINLGSTGAPPSAAPSGTPSTSAAPTGSAPNGASAAPGAANPAADRPNARDQLWVPIVVLALLVLSIEWCIYHRDALLRGWRAATNRLRRPARDTT